MSLEARVVSASVHYVPRRLDPPLRISSGLITAITEARAEVVVRVGGVEAAGRSSMYLSDLWAWPDPERTHDERDALLRGLCDTIASDLPAICGGPDAHPLELGMRLHNGVCHAAGDPPALARAMCASPFDAAIHDGAGIALGLPAMDLYAEPFAAPAADDLFPGAGASRAICAMLQRPVPRFDAWLVTGAKANLTDAMQPWVVQRGYRAFKVKILGADNAEDAALTSEVYRTAIALGARDPRLCADSNCANPDAASVGDYLKRVRELDPDAYRALEYVEQPTGRDITRHAFDWRPVTALRPVLLDEGLTGSDVFETALRQGWSGFALKTCKGHSFALVAAAWAHAHGMQLALQDLTNPGLSAIHAAIFASRVPTINGVELNSPQFTPAANEEWLPRLAPLLAPEDGVHHVPPADTPGLGSRL